MNQELDSRYLDWQLTLEHLKYIHFTGHGFGVLSGGCQPEIFPIPTSRLPNGRWEVLRGSTGGQQRWEDVLDSAANDSSVFTIIEKAPRAFSWLKVPTSAFIFKTLLRHYAKRALTHGKKIWYWDADAKAIKDGQNLYFKRRTVRGFVNESIPFPLKVKRYKKNT